MHDDQRLTFVEASPSIDRFNYWSNKSRDINCYVVKQKFVYISDTMPGNM